MLEGKISVWSLALAVSLQGKTKDLRHGQNFPNHHKDTEAALHFSKKGKRELPAWSRVERAYIKAFVENEEFKENSNIQIYPSIHAWIGGGGEKSDTPWTGQPPSTPMTSVCAGHRDSQI